MNILLAYFNAIFKHYIFYIFTYFFQIDNVGNPSWQAQITGTKIWSLEPPPECYYECYDSHFQITVNPGEISE